MVVAFRFDRGGEGALHSHPHVQATYVAVGPLPLHHRRTGRARSGPATAFVIPGGAIHGCRCLEAGVLIDSFTPRRDDFLLKGPPMLTVETRPPCPPVPRPRAWTPPPCAPTPSFGQGLFADGEIRLVYTHYDRMIVGGAVPAGGPLTLDHVKECGTASLLDRREMGWSTSAARAR
jgi:hypothetical protein